MEKLPMVILIVGASMIMFSTVKFLFHRLHKNYANLHTRFLEQVLSLLVVIFCIINVYETYNPGINFNQILLRGSALIVGILGFAAQPAISDMICGFLISINKPFEIGDRIIVEGQEPGVVEDISLRHTVLRIYDDLRIIVPNSIMNSKIVINTSYKQKTRGIHLVYNVSYDTDVPFAMNLIRDAVAASPYPLEVENNGIKEDSSPVYFLKFADSSLVLETTIKVKPPTNNYIAATDVNLRVLELFRQNGIEIPYPYINVVESDGGGESANIAQPSQDAHRKKPMKRVMRTQKVMLSANENNVEKVVEVAEQFAAKRAMDRRSANQLSLLSEEAVIFVQSLIEEKNTTFWIEGSGVEYRIHLNMKTNVNERLYNRLMNISSSGKNEGATPLVGAFQKVVLKGMKLFSNENEDAANSVSNYSWNLSEDDDIQSEIGQSILTSLSDDVKINITKSAVKVEIMKKVKPGSKDEKKVLK